MRLSRFIPAAFAVMALLPSVGSAQQVQYVDHVGSLQLGAPNPFTPVIRPFVGPYTMKYTATNSLFNIFCIDFDNSFSGNPFNARILTFADAVNSSLSFNGVDNFTALKRALGTTTLYHSPGSIPNNSAEYLVRLQTAGAISKGFGATEVPSWEERHYAIWGIFSGNVTPYVNDGIDPYDYITAGIADVNGGYDASDFRIIIDERAWDRTYTGGLEQTSIVESVVPEPGTYALVGVGMIVLAGVSRRRNRCRQSTGESARLV